MFNFALGIVVGAAFAPFWMMLYNSYVKPTVTKFFEKK